MSQTFLVQRGAQLLSKHCTELLTCLKQILEARCDQALPEHAQRAVSEMVERVLLPSNSDGPGLVHGLLHTVVSLTALAAENSASTGNALRYQACLQQRLLAAECLYLVVCHSTLTLFGPTSMQGGQSTDSLTGGELLHLVQALHTVSDSLAAAPVSTPDNPTHEVVFLLTMCLFRVADYRTGTVPRGSADLARVQAAPLMAAHLSACPDTYTAFKNALGLSGGASWLHTGAHGATLLAIVLLLHSLQRPNLVALADSEVSHLAQTVHLPSEAPVDPAVAWAFAHPDTPVVWWDVQASTSAALPSALPEHPSRGESLTALLRQHGRVSERMRTMLHRALNHGGVQFLTRGLASPAVQACTLTLPAFTPLLLDSVAELLRFDRFTSGTLMRRSWSMHEEQIRRAADSEAPGDFFSPAGASAALAARAQGRLGTALKRARAGDHLEDIADFFAVLVTLDPQRAALFWCVAGSMATALEAGPDGSGGGGPTSDFMEGGGDSMLEGLHHGDRFAEHPSAFELCGGGDTGAVPFVTAVANAAAEGGHDAKAAYVRLLAALAPPTTSAANTSCTQHAYDFLNPPVSGAYGGAREAQGGAYTPSTGMFTPERSLLGHDTSTAFGAEPGDMPDAGHFHAQPQVTLPSLLRELNTIAKRLVPPPQTPSQVRGGGRGGQPTPTLAPAGPAPGLTGVEVDLVLGICRLIQALCACPRLRAAFQAAYPDARRALLGLAKQQLPADVKGALYRVLGTLSLDPDAAPDMWRLLDQQGILATLPRHALSAVEEAPRRGVAWMGGRTPRSGVAPGPISALECADTAESFLGAPPHSTSGIGLELQAVEEVDLRFPSTEGFLHLLRCLALGERATSAGQAVAATLGAGQRLPGTAPYLRFAMDTVLCGAFKRRYDHRAREGPWRLAAHALTILHDALAAYTVHFPAPEVQGSPQPPMGQAVPGTQDSLHGRQFGRGAVPHLSKAALASITPGLPQWDFSPHLPAAAARQHNEAARYTPPTVGGVEDGQAGFGMAQDPRQEVAALYASTVSPPRSSGYLVMYQLLAGDALLHACLALLLHGGGADALKQDAAASMPGARGGAAAHEFGSDFFAEAAGRARQPASGTLERKEEEEEEEDAGAHTPASPAPRHPRVGQHTSTAHAAQGVVLGAGGSETWWRERCVVLVLQVLRQVLAKEESFLEAVRACGRSHVAAPDATPLRSLRQQLLDLKVIPPILRYAAYSTGQDGRVSLAAVQVLSGLTTGPRATSTFHAELVSQLTRQPALWGTPVRRRNMRGSGGGGDLRPGHSGPGEVGYSLGLPREQDGTVCLAFRYGPADAYGSEGYADDADGQGEEWEELTLQALATHESTQRGSGRGRKRSATSLVSYAAPSALVKKRRTATGWVGGSHLAALQRALARALAPDSGSAADDARLTLLALRMVLGSAMGGVPSVHGAQHEGGAGGLTAAAGDEATVEDGLLTLLVGAGAGADGVPSTSTVWGSDDIPADAYKRVALLLGVDPAGGGCSGRGGFLADMPALDMGTGVDMVHVSSRVWITRSAQDEQEMAFLAGHLAHRAAAKALLAWLHSMVVLDFPQAGRGGVGVDGLGIAAAVTAASVPTLDGLPRENIGLELLGFGKMVRNAAGVTDPDELRALALRGGSSGSAAMDTAADMHEAAKSARRNPLLRAIIGAVGARGGAFRHPVDTAAAAAVLNSLMNIGLLAPAVHQTLCDVQGSDPRPYWSALLWDCGLCGAHALSLSDMHVTGAGVGASAGRPADLGLAALEEEERLVTADAVAMSGAALQTLVQAHGQGGRATGPNLALRADEVSVLAQVTATALEPLCTLRADGVVGRRALAALVLRGVAAEVLLLSPTATATASASAAPHSLVYALAALFSAVPPPSGGSAASAAALWLAALPLDEPVHLLHAATHGPASSSPDASIGPFLSAALALYKQRVGGVDPDVGEGVVDPLPPATATAPLLGLRGGLGQLAATVLQDAGRLRRGGPAPSHARRGTGHTLEVGAYTLDVLSTTAMRLVMLAGMAHKALRPPHLADQGAEESGGGYSAVRTLIGGGSSSFLQGGTTLVGGGEGASSHVHGSGHRGAAVHPAVAGAALLRGCGWVRTYNLLVRSTSTATSLVSAWNTAVTVGLNLGGAALTQALRGPPLRGLAGKAPRGSMDSVTAAPPAAGGDGPTMLPTSSTGDAVSTLTHDLLHAVLSKWRGVAPDRTPLPLADALARTTTSLVWTLRGTASLGAHAPGLAPPPSTAAQVLEGGATYTAVTGSGVAVGALLRSARRAEAIMRDLTSLLCARQGASASAVGIGSALDVSPVLGGAASVTCRTWLYAALGHAMQHACGQALPPLTRRVLALTALLAPGSTAPLAILRQAASAEGTSSGGARSMSLLRLARGALTRSTVPHDPNDSTLATALLCVTPGQRGAPDTGVDVAVLAGTLDAQGMEAAGGWEAVGEVPTLPGVVAVEGAAALAALGVFETPAAPSLLDHAQHTATEGLPSTSPGGAYPAEAVTGVDRAALMAAVDRSSAGLGAAVAAVGSALVRSAATDATSGSPALRTAALQALGQVLAFARQMRSVAPSGAVASAARGWISGLQPSRRVASLVATLVAADSYEAALRSKLSAGSVASVQAMYAQAASAAQAARAFAASRGQLTALGGGTDGQGPLLPPLWGASPAPLPDEGERGGATDPQLDSVSLALTRAQSALDTTGPGAFTQGLDTADPAAVATLASSALTTFVQLCMAPGGADALLAEDILGALTDLQWLAAARDALASAFSMGPPASLAALLEVVAPRLRTVLLLLRSLLACRPGDTSTLEGCRVWLGTHATLLRVLLQVASTPAAPLTALHLAAHTAHLLTTLITPPTGTERRLPVQEEVMTLLRAHTLHSLLMRLAARLAAQPGAAPYAVASSTDASQAAGAAWGQGMDVARVRLARGVVQASGGIGAWTTPPPEITELHGSVPWWATMTPLTPWERNLASRRVALGPLGGLVQTQYAAAAVALGQKALLAALAYQRVQVPVSGLGQPGAPMLYLPSTQAAGDDAVAPIGTLVDTVIQAGVAARGALESLVTLRRIAMVGVPAAASLDACEAQLPPPHGYGMGGSSGAAPEDSRSLARTATATAPVVVWRALTRARESARILTEALESALYIWLLHAAAQAEGTEVRQSALSAAPLVPALAPVSPFVAATLRQLTKLTVASR